MAVQTFRRYNMVLRFIVFGSLFIFLLGSCSGSTSSTSDYQEDKHEPTDAKTLFILHCESCHGMEGNKGVSGAADLQKSKIPDSKIKHVIENGNDKGMMPYKDIITNPEEISSLVEYVKTLRK